jgi:hypothetical protein
MTTKNEKKAAAAKKMAASSTAKGSKTTATGEKPAKKAYSSLDNVIRDIKVPGIGGGADLTVKVRIYKVKPAVVQALVAGEVELTATELLGLESADKKELKAWLKTKRAMMTKKVKATGNSTALLQKRFNAIIKRVAKLDLGVMPAEIAVAVQNARASMQMAFDLAAPKAE